MPDDDLTNLLCRADAGDTASAESAYRELLRLVRMMVRSGMGARLRDHRDSGDVCQSIARSFVEDHRARAIAFASERELVGYLRTVVSTKLAMLARSDRALKRAGPADGRIVPLEDEGPAAPGRTPDPVGDMASREIIDRAQRDLSDPEREIARLRLAGQSWEQIASHIGGDAQSVRKRWSRVLARLSATPLE